MAITLAEDDCAHWLDALTTADLDLHGVISQEGINPRQTLEDLAEELGVDLSCVGACLALLQSGYCLLCGGAPMAMLSFSPRREVYRACFDGDCAEDMSALSTPSAGVWLTLLAAELGELPRSDDHWLIARLGAGGVEAANDYVRDLAGNYARQICVRPGAGLPSPDNYEALVGRAFWRCASHCLR